MSGLKILIVEDNVAHQRLAMLNCAKNGYSYGVASNAEEAIGELRLDPSYSVILLDLGIPRSKESQSLLQRLLSLRRTGLLSAKIVAITAHAMEIDRAECLKLGVDEYLSKPYTTTQFRTILSQCDEVRRSEERAS